MIRYSCPHCGERLQVDDRLAGNAYACSLCKRTSVVPGGEQRAAVVPAQAPAARRPVSPAQTASVPMPIMQAPEVELLPPLAPTAPPVAGQPQVIQIYNITQAPVTPPATPPPSPAEANNGLALGAFAPSASSVFFTPLSLLPLAMGIYAWHQSVTAPQQWGGRGYAIAAVCISGFALAYMAFAVGVWTVIVGALGI